MLRIIIMKLLYNWLLRMDICSKLHLYYKMLLNMLLDTKIDRIQGSLKYVLIMFREAVIARITRLTPLSVEVILFMTVLMYPREVTSLRMLKSKAVQDTVDSIIK